VIAHLLNPLLNLHGWEAYLLVGALVFAEASILIGFVFPGETAVILGGVVASRDHVNIVILIIIVVACAIAGDSVGYLVGEKWGRRLLATRLLRKRQRLLAAVFNQLNRRGAIVVFLSRFTAFLRAAVPGLAGISSMPYRIFLPANAAGGLIWGTGFCLLGYVLGHAYTKVEHASSIASDVLLGLIAVAIVVVVIRRRRREKAVLSGQRDPSFDDGGWSIDGGSSEGVGRP
jgi:membrane protein DedA with SNARE-associated domain